MNTRIASLDEYREQYRLSCEDPENFWSNIASRYQWFKPWDTVLSWDFDRLDVRWFDGAQLNITENCLDRHLETRGEEVAILWEPNHPDHAQRKLTYRQLHAEVCRTANMMKKTGVQKGDRVCIYMPMVPEAAIAMLACARIGAIHSVVFAGFSAQSLADRINDSNCGFVLCRRRLPWREGDRPESNRGRGLVKDGMCEAGDCPKTYCSPHRHAAKP